MADPPKKDPAQTGNPHRSAAKRKFVATCWGRDNLSWWDAEIQTIDKLKSFPTRLLTLDEATPGGAIDEASVSVLVHEYHQLLEPSHSGVAHVERRKTKPDLIVLHWTSGRGTNPEGPLEKVTMAPYLVGRTGAIFRYFDETKYTSWHAGRRANSRSIGIEHASAGQLFRTGYNGAGEPTDFCYCERYKDEKGPAPAYCKVSDTQFWKRIDGRPYGRAKQPTARNYALFTPEQMQASARLVRYLCKKHDIPMTPLQENLRGTHLADEELAQFRGILAHLPCATGVGDDDHDDDLLQFDWSLLADTGTISEEDRQLQRRLDDKTGE